LNVFIKRAQRPNKVWGFAERECFDWASTISEQVRHCRAQETSNKVEKRLCKWTLTKGRKESLEMVFYLNKYWKFYKASLVEYYSVCIIF